MFLILIRLSRPNDYASEQGARFEVHLTKARGLFGEEAEPFEAQLSTNDDQTIWTVKKLEDVNLEKIQQFLNEGMSQREIADEIGISKSQVNRLCKKHNLTKAG